MVRFFLCALVVVTLTGCAEGRGEPVGTTRLTASGAWDGAHAEPFIAQTKRARVRGEILWPAQVHGGPPRLVILVAGARGSGRTAIALRLAEAGMATLRYSDGVAIDGEVVSASAEALRRDPRVGPIVLVADGRAEALAADNVDARIAMADGATPSEVVAALSKHVQPIP